MLKTPFLCLLFFPSLVSPALPLPPSTVVAAALAWAQQLVNSSAACFNTTLEPSSSSLPYGQNTLIGQLLTFHFPPSPVPFPSSCSSHPPCPRVLHSGSGSPDLGAATTVACFNTTLESSSSLPYGENTHTLWAPVHNPSSQPPPLVPSHNSGSSPHLGAAASQLLCCLFQHHTGVLLITAPRPVINIPFSLSPSPSSPPPPPPLPSCPLQWQQQP
ncbi:unnamed protein product [Closterium sp. NIES-53]